MRRILAAVALDDHGRAVISASRWLAGDGTVRAVHAYRRPEAAVFEANSSPPTREQALRALRGMVAGAPGAEHKQLEGPADRAILVEARAWRADAIAVAPRSRPALEKWMLGSTSQKVLRDAPVSVLLVRDARPPRSILVCTDLHAPSRIAAEAARSVASINNARMTVLFAAHPAVWGPKATAPWPPDALDIDADWLDRAQQEAVHAWLATKVHEFNEKHLGGKAAEIVREGVPQDVILAEAGKHDLVVVGTHGPTAYERAIIGSVAEAVATRAGGNVLVVKAQRERLS